MKIHDISIPIKTEMPFWPGDPIVELTSYSAISLGNSTNMTQIQMSVHTGTHIDAPKHFIDNGKTIDQIPLEQLCGKTLVIHMGDDVDVIREKELKIYHWASIIEKTRKVIFRTRNSSLWASYPVDFQRDYVGIDASGSEFLRGLGVQLVGIDYLSVAPFKETKPSHEILLSSDIVLLEGLNLTNIEGGYYDLFCLPLNIVGSDGSPARAILVENQ